MKKEGDTQNKEPSYITFNKDFIVGTTRVVIGNTLYRADSIDGQPIEFFKRYIEEAQTKLAIHQRLTELNAFKTFIRGDFHGI